MIDQLLEELRTRPATDDEIKALRRATRVVVQRTFPDGEHGTRVYSAEEAAAEIERLTSGQPKPDLVTIDNGKGCRFTINRSDLGKFTNAGQVTIGDL